MSPLPPRARRLASRVAAAAAAGSLAMLVVTLVAAGAAQLPAGSAASGQVTLSPSTGASNTAVIMIPPVGADCPGAGADNFRFHTYIAPRTLDPSQLQYNAQGSPTAAGAFNLRTAAGQLLRSLSPAIGDNFLQQQDFSFQSGAFGPTFLPPGEYWIGFACTAPDGQTTPGVIGGPTDGFLDVVEFWASPITITASAGAGPNNFTYSVPPPDTTTTTTTAAAPTTAAVTTVAPVTTVAGVTTTATTVPTSVTTTTATTIAGVTTTVGTSTTSTNPAVTVASGGSSSGSGASTATLAPASSTLVPTGFPAVAVAVWALLFVAFGRIAVLLGRRPRVLPPRER